MLHDSLHYLFLELYSTGLKCDVIELISWEKACVHILNNLFLLPDLQDECFESLWLYLRPYKLPRGFLCSIVWT